MTRHVRPILNLLLVLAISFAAAQAQAQQQKTVAVMSVSSIDNLFENIAYLTEAGGSPDVGQMVTMMSGAYLDGVDRGNPIGMVLTTDGQEFVPLGFIPVTDLDKVFSVLEDQVGSPRDAGNGIKEIPGQQPMFVKEQGEWAYVGQTIESMANLPAKPTTLLGNLPNEYDIAIRGNIRNIPKSYLDMAVEGIREGIRSGLEQLPDEDQEAQEKMLESQVQQMQMYIEESDQITIGWKTEPANKRTYLDLSFTAISGGKLAKQMDGLANSTSDFTGFMIPGAAMSMNFSSEVPPEQIASAVETMTTMKEAALDEIENDEDLDDTSRMAAREMSGAAIDIFIETIKTGKMDGAASVVLDSGQVQVLGGFHVADGKDVEKILQRVADLAKDEPKFPGINFNADKAGGVSFHTMTMPVPDDEEEARKILGDTMEMAIGTSQDSAYIGFGKNCVANLKQIIGSQKKAAKVMPFDMTVSLTPIMEFVANMEDNPLIGSVTDALKEDEKDHVRIQVRPIKNGFTYRLEMEEGVMRAIGEGVKMAGAGGF